MEYDENTKLYSQLYVQSSRNLNCSTPTVIYLWEGNLKCKSADHLQYFVVSLWLHAQEKDIDSLTIKNTFLEEVIISYSWFLLKRS